MKSYLQHLENNEAILLMYLGNELPVVDRAEVEQMLASDARLRAELENLRQTHQLAFDALESLDAMVRLPVSPLVAQQRVSELVRGWAERRRLPVAESSRRRRQIPWWRSGLAAAASLMMGYYIWAVYHPGERHDHQNYHELNDNETMAILYNSFETSNAENSNLVEHVAEVASIAPTAADDTFDSASDSKSTGAP
jgi:hypothetical protein